MGLFGIGPFQRMVMGQRGGAVPIIYLLRDEFTTAEAAPMATPRTCEPGPGTLTVFDPGNRMSITGSKLQIASAATGYSLISAPFARANGKAAFGVISPGSGTGTTRLGFSDGALNFTKQSFQPAGNRAGSSVYVFSSMLELYDPTVVQKYFVILRSVGAFFGGYIAGVPYLFYVDTSQTHANVEVGLVASTAGMFTQTIDNFWVVEATNSLLDTDWGVATSRTASPATGATASMTASGLVEFTWTPAAGETLDLMVRRTDDDNTWVIRCDQAGSKLYLYEKDTGNETERGASGGVAQTWTPGTKYRIFVACEGQEIRVYTMLAVTGGNGGLVVKYTTASFNQAATGVKVTGFATGAELVCWPREVQLPSPFLLNVAKRLDVSGDSRTDGTTWQTTLRDNLQATSSSVWLPNVQIATSGFNAATLRSLLEASMPPFANMLDYALLNIGVNDAINLPFPDEATWKANYLGCLDAFINSCPSITVYCMKVWARTYDAQCATVNGWIDDCIADRSFARPGPDESVWMKGADNGATMTLDGLHYSAAGNIECAAQWRAVLSGA